MRKYPLMPLFWALQIMRPLQKKKMKRSDSLRLGWAYAHLHQVLAGEKELLEVTFHYGMGVRVHLDTYQLGIRQ